MLVIRDEQVDAFRQLRIRQFKERLAAHLANVTPECFRDDCFDRQIDSFIALAADSGFASEKHVAALAEFVLRSSGAFDIEALPISWQNVIFAYKVDPLLKLNRLDTLRVSAQESSR